MNTRTLTVFSLVFVGGLFAGTPALAQNAMPASASSTMSQGSMHKRMMKDAMHKDAMKGSMHEHGMKMKKDAMQKSAMKKHAMMRKDDSMKSSQAGGKSAGE